MVKLMEGLRSAAVWGLGTVLVLVRGAAPIQLTGNTLL